MKAIAAMSLNRVIGNGPDIPWKIPGEQAEFKKLTLGHALVMGRTTYESIGRPLPGRTTIVVTRQHDWAADGVEVAHSLDDAITLAAGLDDETFLVGGAQVYAEALDRDLVHTLVVSRVRQAPEGDAWFPAIDWERWREVAHEPHADFDVVTYERA